MPRPLITLPCTAQELENALHSVCEHHGAWDAEVRTEDGFVRVSHVPGVTHIRKTQLVLCDKADNTKGWQNESVHQR